LNSNFMKSMAAIAYLLGADLGVTSVTANAAAKTKGCRDAAAPVTDISLPSRYKAGDATHSDIDEESNAQVEKALAPIDNFVRGLASAADQIDQPLKRKIAANCIVATLVRWANGNALEGAMTMNARLALSARISGVAAVYNRIKAKSPPNPDKQAIIEAWLSTLAQNQIDFFDNDAPPMASRNNHRAWRRRQTK